MTTEKAAKLPAGMRQNEFLSSVEVREEYSKPFGQNHYYLFKKHPAWPKPIISNGGKEIYSRRSVDRFYELLAQAPSLEEFLRRAGASSIGGG